jgi:hypothetical protein
MTAMTFMPLPIDVLRMDIATVTAVAARTNPEQDGKLHDRAIHREAIIGTSTVIAFGENHPISTLEHLSETQTHQ